MWDFSLDRFRRGQLVCPRVNRNRAREGGDTMAKKKAAKKKKK
jgi:hypothetical protein